MKKFNKKYCSRECLLNRFSPAYFLCSFFLFSWLGCLFLSDELNAMTTRSFGYFPPQNILVDQDQRSMETSRIGLQNNVGSLAFGFLKLSTLAGEKAPLLTYISEDESSTLRFPDEPPAEPAAYKTSGYRGMVPLTLKGATVVDSAQALKLYKADQTLFIDVMPHIPKPPNLPSTMIWRSKVRTNIEGSSWLANVGYGALPPEMNEYFEGNLAKLTKGRKDKPLLFYCQEKCWMSWNAAKRALEYGYSKVYWYPRGTDGWIENGGKVIKDTPIPLPLMTRNLSN